MRLFACIFVDFFIEYTRLRLQKMTLIRLKVHDNNFKILKFKQVLKVVNIFCLVETNIQNIAFFNIPYCPVKKFKSAGF